MNVSGADVIVVGGGIVGTAAAAFLTDAGMRVVLVEREGLAAGASGANSGVVQQPFDPILVGLYRDTVALYRELSAAGVGFRLPDTPAGMLFLAEDESAARRYAESVTQAFPTLGVEVLEGRTLQEFEPSLGPNLWACLVETGYPVVPAGSTYVYATLAEAGGAIVRLGRSAVPVFRGDSAIGVRVDEQLLEADAVLIAAGPWTSALLDPTGRWLPIRALWGVVVEADLADPPLHPLEEASIEAAIGVRDEPDQSGQVRVGGDLPTAELDFSLVPQLPSSAVGSTFLDEEPDPRKWIEPILLRAMRYVPRLVDAPIRGVRACARPQSADGRPLIGQVPGRNSLFVCAGHGPWGISTGPASARLVVDLILGKDPTVAPAFEPARLI